MFNFILGCLVTLNVLLTYEVVTHRKNSQKLVERLLQRKNHPSMQHNVNGIRRVK